MTPQANTQHTEDKRIFWNKQDTLQVCRRLFALRDVGPDDMTWPEALDAAQRACMAPDRWRPFTGSMLRRFRRIYDEWIDKHPDQAHNDRELARELLKVRSHDTPVERTETPPNAPSAPTPMNPLGPVELALQRVIGDAVENRIGILVQAMRDEIERSRMETQSLLSQQYDALMCYFDPDYKARCEERAEYVPDPDHTPVLINSVRTKRKRVLISGGQTDQFHGIKMHFKGIDFVFVDGRNPRQIGAGGWYDLVICTKYTNHSARNALIGLHGNKVVTIDGALNNCIAAVKQYLDL